MHMFTEHCSVAPFVTSIMSFASNIASKKLTLSAIDLLEKMLELDTDKRITAEQATQHNLDQFDQTVIIRILVHCFG